MEIKIGKRLIVFIFIGVILLLGLFTTYNNGVASEAFKFVDEKKYVYPLGSLVGVKATTDGVLVLGYEEKGVQYIGGIQIGDNITKIEGIPIKGDKDIKKLLNKLKKKEIKVTFERDGKYMEETVQTKYENGNYRLGLWVRDKISGIGTMTFYDPESETFRAIGHSITDIDTEKLLKIKQGELYKLTNVEVLKSTKDKIGKIKADVKNEKSIGNFKNNNTVGISGKFKGEFRGEFPLIEVGDSKDVKLGKAMILFEDKNRNVTSYEVKIDSLENDKSNNRNMIIEVVDKKLLHYTGGIVQGMSGAPIIQNNKIIGAITHVFKDNPKKGYGIFIDEMIELDCKD